jgi:hypothetical protein
MPQAHTHATLYAGWKEHMPSTSAKENQPQQATGAAGIEYDKTTKVKAIKAWLPQHLNGIWRIKWGCSQGPAQSSGTQGSRVSKKCGCPFALVATHTAGSDQVLVSEVRMNACSRLMWRRRLPVSAQHGVHFLLACCLQEEAHHFHEGSSNLKLDLQIQNYIIQLHRLGIKPQAILRSVNEQQRDGHLCDNMPTPANTPGYYTQFANSRFKVGRGLSHAEGMPVMMVFFNPG